MRFTRERRIEFGGWYVLVWRAFPSRDPFRPGRDRISGKASPVPETVPRVLLGLVQTVLGCGRPCVYRHNRDSAVVLGPGSLGDLRGLERLIPGVRRPRNVMTRRFVTIQNLNTRDWTGGDAGLEPSRTGSLSRCLRIGRERSPTVGPNYDDSPQRRDGILT